MCSFCYRVTSTGFKASSDSSSQIYLNALFMCQSSSSLQISYQNATARRFVFAWLSHRSQHAHFPPRPFIEKLDDVKRGRDIRACWVSPHPDSMTNPQQRKTKREGACYDWVPCSVTLTSLQTRPSPCSYNYSHCLSR